MKIDIDNHPQPALDVAQLLSGAIVEKKLSCSRSFLFLQRKKGAIKYIKIGVKILYDPADVTEFLSKNKKGG
jgi:hypothetical protein